MVQSEPRSHTEDVNFEPSQHTILEDTTRFSCRQSRKILSCLIRSTLLIDIFCDSTCVGYQNIINIKYHY